MSTRNQQVSQKLSVTTVLKQIATLALILVVPLTSYQVTANSATEETAEIDLEPRGMEVPDSKGPNFLPQDSEPHKANTTPSSEVAKNVGKSELKSAAKKSLADQVFKFDNKIGKAVRLSTDATKLRDVTLSKLLNEVDEFTKICLGGGTGSGQGTGKGKSIGGKLNSLLGSSPVGSGIGVTPLGIPISIPTPGLIGTPLGNSPLGSLTNSIKQPRDKLAKATKIKDSVSAIANQPLQISNYKPSNSMKLLNTVRKVNDLYRKVSLTSSVAHQIVRRIENDELVLDEYSQTLYEAYQAETDPELAAALMETLEDYLEGEK